MLSPGSAASGRRPGKYILLKSYVLFYVCKTILVLLSYLIALCYMCVVLRALYLFDVFNCVFVLLARPDFSGGAGRHFYGQNQNAINDLWQRNGSQLSYLRFFL